MNSAVFFSPVEVAHVPRRRGLPGEKGRKLHVEVQRVIFLFRTVESKVHVTVIVPRQQFRSGGEARRITASGTRVGVKRLFRAVRQADEPFSADGPAVGDADALDLHAVGKKLHVQHLDGLPGIGEDPPEDVEARLAHTAVGEGRSRDRGEFSLPDRPFILKR